MNRELDDYRAYREHKAYKQIIYACDKCCTKLSYGGEPCIHCHRGKGVQIEPVPSESLQERSGTKNMCSGIPRRPKRARAIRD